jgi:Tol biopolymer transport system component
MSYKQIAIICVVLAILLSAKLVISALTPVAEKSAPIDTSTSNIKTSTIPYIVVDDNDSLSQSEANQNVSDNCSPKIAFISDRDGNQEIYIMNTNGSEQTNLTNNKDNDYIPRISPDGTKIAFLSERKTTSYEIENYIVSSKSYYANIPHQSNQFYIDLNMVDTNSHKIRGLITDFGYNPVYWRNDDEISYIGQYETICIFNINNSDFALQKKGLNHIGEFNWSPDGSRTAFGCNNVYIWHSEIDDIQKLTNFPYCAICNGCQVYNYQWSPSGNKIVFQSIKDSNSEIYVVDADGTNMKRLTINAVADTDPTWSPDGNKIAFCSNGDIHFIDINILQDTQLTKSPAYESEPAWSPDSSKIVFTSESHNSKEIYMMAADGSNRIQLTSKGDNYSPQWCSN